METENKQHTNWLAFFLIIVFVVLLAVLIGYLYLNKGKATSTTTTTSTTPTTKTTPVTTANVSITKDGFVPATIQIKKGGQVTWTNTDSTSHQVITDPHPAHINLKDLDSDPLGQGDSFTFTFEKAGTYGYHDEMNPLKFKGAVIVK
jgi:plastocyanin